MFDNYFFDLIYIDGSHSYENVKKDIINWKERVKDGGYICGHDSNLPDVIMAIEETLDISKIKIYSDTSWCIRK